MANLVGSRGPKCCGEPTHRVRFFGTIEAFDKARQHPDMASKLAAHVGYECQHCHKVRTAETEEDAALRFRTA